MMNRRNNGDLRHVLLCVMIYSLLLAPFGHALSHDLAVFGPGDVERHAVLAGQDDDPDHAHHDGLPDEQRAGHSHGHNPADHIHDIPAPASFWKHSFPPAGNRWRAVASLSHGDGQSLGIERPPKS